MLGSISIRSRSLSGERRNNQLTGLAWWMPHVFGTFEAAGRADSALACCRTRTSWWLMTGGGSEPGDIGRYLTRSIRSDAALPLDLASDAGPRARPSRSRDRRPATLGAAQPPRGRMPNRASGVSTSSGTSVPGVAPSRSFAGPRHQRAPSRPYERWRARPAARHGTAPHVGRRWRTVGWTSPSGRGTGGYALSSTV